MSNTEFACLVLLFLVPFIAFAFWLKRLGEKQEEKFRSEIIAYAKREGAKFLGSNVECSHILDGFDLAGKAKHCVLRNVVELGDSEKKCFIGSYTWWHGGGDGPTSCEQTVFVVVDETTTSCFEKAHFGRRGIMQFLFYKLRRPDSMFPKFVADVITSRNWDVELFRNRCLIYRLQKLHFPDQYDELLADVDLVWEHLRKTRNKDNSKGTQLNVDY